MNLQKQFFKLSFPLRIIIAIAVILLLKYIYIFIMKKYFPEPFGNPTRCVYYYMEGCGYCKKLDPEWKKLTQTYQGNVQLKKIQNTQAGGDLDKYGIKGFPAIILIDGQGNHKEFTGSRTSSDILNFINGK